MLRRVARPASNLPCRDSWHQLQDFALTNVDQAAMREMRVRDSNMGMLISRWEKPCTSSIDWKAAEESIQHKNVVSAAREFYESRITALDAFGKEDHKVAVESQMKGWQLYDAAVSSCTKSVEKAETMMDNGARALWISAHNPGVNELHADEWLDIDQYVAASVERYVGHSMMHLPTKLDTPEGVDSLREQMFTSFRTCAARSAQPIDAMYVSDRASWDYYDLNRGLLVEHMMYFLTKTGMDARFFPEVMSMVQHKEIVEARTDFWNVLTRRKRFFQERDLKREQQLEFQPHDLEHEGEKYYAGVISQMKDATELQVARLMGNYIFLCEGHIPVQTKAAALKAAQSDKGQGVFYTLGSDVHCLFYKPAAAIAEASPVDSVNNFVDHLTLSGARLPVHVAAMHTTFAKLLDTRRENQDGRWFSLEGETQADAFLRRLKDTDETRAIFENYVTEMKGRWEGAQVVADKDLEATLAEVERKYTIECSEYNRMLSEFTDEATLELSELTEEGAYVNLTA